MRIAMLGLRGVPATFGGIERHVEEVGARLVEMGEDVTVFCRNNYAADRRAEHRGMRLRYLPTVGTKHLDAIVHTGLAAPLSLAGFDVVHFHAVGPGLLSPLPAYLSHARVVQTVHGLDSERQKWGPLATAVLRAGEWLSARVPDTTIVVSRVLEQHYLRRYGRLTHYVPNGIEVQPPAGGDEVLRRLGLRPGGYLLFVGRLVPEKAPDLLLRAFALVKTDLRLVVVGGSSHSDEYVATVEGLAAGDDRVLLTGYLYNHDLAQLYAHAAAFVTPSTMEGSPLTLLEAAAAGTPVLASDIPAHLELLGVDSAGRRSFPAGDAQALAASISRVTADLDAERLGAARLREELLAARSWDAVAAATQDVYRRVLG
jgi:glycosyltransferase involved in cell wall biosynthesis